MTASSRWLSSAEFAHLAGISPQAARKALKNGAEGHEWRDHCLDVKFRVGRGGRGGFSYEVRAASLPAAIDLTPSRQDIRRPVLSVGRAPSRSSDVVSAKWKSIQPCLLMAKNSSERATAIIAAADASGRCRRTLYRWIARYEARGVGGLAREKSASSSQRRVLVSRCFDTAFALAGYSKSDLERISVALERTLKGLWASRAEGAGAAEVRKLAEFLLLELCEANGVELPQHAMRLSRRGVDRFAHYRIVNVRRNDRKRFDDGRPRIRRDWTGLAPMERIIADVKHLDVIVKRADGTPAWPKIVAFMDAGTSRVFVHPVLLERGEGVRQEHVVEAFLAMVSDPAWGFPQGLYLDNGKEFASLVKIDQAMQQLNQPGARTLIFAAPYNAAAKPIEGLFARLDRYVFALLPGYAGPNRLAKKTQTLGRPPAPYPGDWDEFCAMLTGLVAAHNRRPVGGRWGNRSPQEWLDQKIADGWRRTLVDPESLDASFADQDSRRVDRGVVKVRGQRFSHPLLVALPSRTVVDLALPWRRAASPMAYLGGAWTYLTQEVVYPARWIEGARVSRRNRLRQESHVTALERDAPTIDPVAVKLRWVERLPATGEAPVLRADLGTGVRQRGAAMRRAKSSIDEFNLRSEKSKLRTLKLTEYLERISQDDD